MQWTTLTTNETLAAVDNAHSSKKCSHFTKMHAHNLPKILLTTLENAHNLRTCSPLIEMLTTLKNAHNLQTWSQLIEMVTTLKNTHNLRTCSQLTEMLTTVWKCSQLCPLTRNAYNTQLCKCSVFAKCVRPSQSVDCTRHTKYTCIFLYIRICRLRFHPFLTDNFFIKEM